jgi:hypothetical protein
LTCRTHRFAPDAKQWAQGPPSITTLPREATQEPHRKVRMNDDQATTNATRKRRPHIPSTNNNVKEPAAPSSPRRAVHQFSAFGAGSERAYPSLAIS